MNNIRSDYDPLTSFGAGLEKSYTKQVRWLYVSDDGALRFRKSSIVSLSLVIAVILAALLSYMPVPTLGLAVFGVTVFLGVCCILFLRVVSANKRAWQQLGVLHPDEDDWLAFIEQVKNLKRAFIWGQDSDLSFALFELNRIVNDEVVSDKVDAIYAQMLSVVLMSHKHGWNTDMSEDVLFSGNCLNGNTDQKSNYHIRNEPSIGKLDIDAD